MSRNLFDFWLFALPRSISINRIIIEMCYDNDAPDIFDASRSLSMGKVWEAQVGTTCTAFDLSPVLNVRTFSRKSFRWSWRLCVIIFRHVPFFWSGFLALRVTSRSVHVRVYVTVVWEFEKISNYYWGSSTFTNELSTRRYR